MYTHDPFATLTAARLYSFRVPLARAVPGSSGARHREGLIVAVEDAAGRCAVAEASPLPGFSSESLQDASTDLAAWVRAAARGGGHTPELPSTSFAVESLAVQLSADEEASTSGQRSIQLNALVSGDDDGVEEAHRLYARGFRTFKIKAGRLSLRREAESSARIVSIGDDVRIRIDANRSWSLTEAAEFASTLSTALRHVHCGDDVVDYFEEPLSDSGELGEFVSQSGFGIGLDESLRDAAYDSTLLDPKIVRAIVVKPTLSGWGALSDPLSFAADRGIDCVVSSAFETGVGLSSLAALAGTISPDVAMGLGTYRWIEDDVLKPRPPLDGPVVQAVRSDVLLASLDFDMLELLVEAGVGT